MELRARHFKRRKAQTISRLRFETQKKFRQKGGSFKREPIQGEC